MVSKDWATEDSLVLQTPGLRVEYSFYGVSVQKESCSAEPAEKWIRPAAEFIGRPRCKKKQPSGPSRNESDSNWAKNNRSLKSVNCLKDCLLPLFSWGVWQARAVCWRTSTWACLTQGMLKQGIRGIPYHCCCLLLGKRVVFFICSPHSFSFGLSFCVQWFTAMTEVVGGVVVSGGGGVSVVGSELAAAACLPPTPFPAFLSCFLWDWGGEWF